MSLRTVLNGLVALAISAAALLWAFRGVDVSELLEQLGHTDPLACSLYFLSLFVGHAVRVVRWGLLIRPLTDVSYRSIAAAASVGLPATFFVPLRLGELVRPAMMKRAGASFTATFASVVVERVSDGVVNLGLFFLLLTVLPAPVAPEVRQFSLFALALFAGALVALGIGVVYREPFLRFVQRLTGVFSESLSQRVTALARAFLEGLEVLRSPTRMVNFVLLSLVFWALMGGGAQILAASYIEGLPVLAGPFATTVVVFAIMIPAGPAFAGTLEAGFRLGLAPFGAPESQVVATAVMAHALQIIGYAIIAGIGFWIATAKERDAAIHTAED